MLTRCAVLGQPIAHSLSPAMHRAAYAELGLDWEYQRVELQAGAIAGFIAGLDESWRGLSVTMPGKTELLSLPGAIVDETARQARSANTVIIDGPPASRQLAVWNTDAPGLANALTRHQAGVRFADAAVLGSGATARSALVGLAALAVQRVVVVARSTAKAAALAPVAADLGLELVARSWEQPMAPTELVVSTIPGSSWDCDLAVRFAQAPLIFDLSYHPWPSDLARAGQAAGARILDGVELLADQAALQLRLMTGRDVGVDLLVAAGRAELARRSADPKLAAPCEP